MCVILYTKINDKIFLAKNRDKVYKPKINIIHEIVDGIEIAYIQDQQTGWVEGINEKGFGIVNSTININDGKKNINSKYKKIKSSKIFNALCEDKPKNLINNLVKKDDENIFEGNTLIYCDNKLYHLEYNINQKYTITEAKPNSVYTNHGINMPSEGFTTGIKGLSSFMRKSIIEKELKKMVNNIKYKCENNNKIYNDISNILNRDYVNIDPRFHPYRDKNTTLKRIKDIEKNQTIVNTTGQLILNITDKELVYYGDVNNSKKIKYINKLPSNYIPKIRVLVHYTKKNTKTKKVFQKKNLKNIYKKFNYNNKTMKNNENNEK